ncbi:COMM domain-containing protein 8 isoform X3 [Ovis aries]|uniref:COMM domain containing 8 n=1 Tax=Ovis aries TaxID=9940 RepID=A0AC11B6K5_SHEEP|nr:COMM domain-containing protein 8 isoform X3 [Ovis aries]
MEPEEGTPLWRLQKLPAERGLQLLHKIIDGICGRTYPLYQDYHSVWDSTEWMHVLEDITTFFKAVVGKNLSDEEISQQLNQLNSSHQEAIMKCLKSRKDEIKKTLLAEIVDISSAQLQDFDWQIKAKAFDCVDHNELWKILREMGIPDHHDLPLEKPVCRSGSNS